MKEQAYHQTLEFERGHWWYAGRRKIILSLLDKFLGEPGKRIVFDMGCGTGLMMQNLAEKAHIYGMDQKFQPADYIPDSIQKRIVVGKLNQIPLGRNTLDGILAFDVIEHLEEDLEFLKTLQQHLKSGGFLFITVPAFNFLWSGEDYVSDHKRRYTLRDLRGLLAKAGYEIRRISYFNFFLFLPICFTILIKRFFFPKDFYASNLKAGPPALNRILTFIFASEAGWLSRHNLPLGASLLAIAIKK